MIKIEDVKLEDIYSAYHGKKEGCRCGCNGYYIYTTLHKDFASKDRGYKIENEEVNDDLVKKIYNKIMNNKQDCTFYFRKYNETQIEGNIDFNNQNKPYTVYFIKNSLWWVFEN